MQHIASLSNQNKRDDKQHGKRFRIYVEIYIHQLPRLRSKLQQPVELFSNQPASNTSHKYGKEIINRLGHPDLTVSNCFLDMSPAMTELNKGY
jgi:hypothetical protein